MGADVRKITAVELRDSHRLGQYAFGHWKDDPAKDEEINWRDPDQTMGAFVAGQLVAKVHNWPMQQVIRGVTKSMAGIAGVASYPMFRGQGLVRQLMQATFANAHEQGQSISSLYPFREQFYARLGYVTTNGQWRITVPVSTLTPYLAASQPTAVYATERHSAKDNREPWLAFVQEMTAHTHGFAWWQEALTDYMWQNWMAADQHLIYVTENGRLIAGARYSIKGFFEDGQLDVREMYWKTLTGRDRLLGFFASHRDGIETIRFIAPFGDNFYAWLPQPTRNYDVDLRMISMMGRVTDVVGALADLPATVNGRFHFTYRDEHAPWLDGAYEVVAENGRLQAQKTSSATSATLSASALSALVYGALSVAEVVHRGWATGLDETAVALLANWFPPLTVFNTNHF